MEREAEILEELHHRNGAHMSGVGSLLSYGQLVFILFNRFRQPYHRHTSRSCSASSDNFLNTSITVYPYRTTAGTKNHGLEVNAEHTTPNQENRSQCADPVADLFP